MISVRLAFIVSLSLAAEFIVFAIQPLTAFATPEYARQTGFECKQCHLDALGGGPLTQEGKNFCRT